MSYTTHSRGRVIEAKASGSKMGHKKPITEFQKVRESQRIARMILNKTTTGLKQARGEGGVADALRIAAIRASYL